MPRAASARRKPTPAPRPAVDPVDRRTRLLEAGAQILATRPYEEVSVQEIAAEAGVAHGLLFHYFGSKRGFYLAVLDRMTKEGMRQFEANTAADPARWLRKELDLFLSGISTEAPLFALLIHGSLGAETEAQQIVSRELHASAQRVIAKLAPQRPSPLLVAAVTAWIASANELGAQWLETGRAVPQRQLRTLLISTLNGTLRKVAALDRTARFDPECFAGA